MRTKETPKKLREEWNHKIGVIYQAVEEDMLTLNDWEQEFIDSISKVLSEEKELSFKQSSVLRKIFNRIE